MNDLYLSKLNQDNGYFDYVRNDVVNFLNSYFSKNRINQKINTVLEVGCGTGITGKLIKKEYAVGKYIGVELVPEVALLAEKNIDKVYCQDFEKMILDDNYQGIDKEKYDLILFLDTLEHMYNPWLVLSTVKEWLNEEGHLVLSIPNTGHISVIKKLFTDNFQYEKSGLLDITHIRFFTLSTIKRMLTDNGYEITAYTTTNDHSMPKIKFFNFITFNLFKRLFIVSYTLIVKKVN